MWGFLAVALATIASTVGTIIQSNRNNKAQRELVEIDNQNQHDLYEEAKEDNSLASQVSQAREAGLNPDLLNLNFSPTSQASYTPYAGNVSPKVSGLATALSCVPMIFDFFNSFIDIDRKIENADYEKQLHDYDLAKNFFEVNHASDSFLFTDMVNHLDEPTLNQFLTGNLSENPFLVNGENYYSYLDGFLSGKQINHLNMKRMWYSQNPKLFSQALKNYDEFNKQFFEYLKFKNSPMNPRDDSGQMNEAVKGLFSVMNDLLTLDWDSQRSAYKAKISQNDYTSEYYNGLSGSKDAGIHNKQSDVMSNKLDSEMVQTGFDKSIMNKIQKLMNGDNIFSQIAGFASILIYRGLSSGQLFNFVPSPANVLK